MVNLGYARGACLFDDVLLPKEAFVGVFSEWVQVYVDAHKMGFTKLLAREPKNRT